MLIKRRGKEVPIPFGPYLAVAGWIALLLGDGNYGSVFAHFGITLI
jgi:leader peptidase (prepilin peptidase)/N-methyltransferase